MTSREFAKLIGVSQPTVSRALNNSSLVAPETKEYVLKKAREYKFELNSQAQSLKTSRTGTIGILFPKHFISMNNNLMLAHVYDCIQQELSSFDYDIMVIYYDSNSRDFSRFERSIRKKKVDGFLVLRMELMDEEMELIQQHQVPCVFMMNANANIREKRDDARRRFNGVDRKKGCDAAGVGSPAVGCKGDIIADRKVEEDTRDTEDTSGGYCLRSGFIFGLGRTADFDNGIFAFLQ